MSFSTTTTKIWNLNFAHVLRCPINFQPYCESFSGHFWTPHHWHVFDHFALSTPTYREFEDGAGAPSASSSSPSPWPRGACAQSSWCQRTRRRRRRSSGSGRPPPLAAVVSPDAARAPRHVCSSLPSGFDTALRGTCRSWNTRWKTCMHARFCCPRTNYTLLPSVINIRMLRTN